MAQDKESLEKPAQGNTPSLPPPKKKGRTARILIAGAASLVIITAVVFYYQTSVAPYESTDDAFIDGYLTLLSSRVPGQVVKLLVADNQEVKAGDTLVEIDPADYQTALAQARADLVVAQSQVIRAQAGTKVDEANILEASALVKASEAQACKATKDLQRYESVESQAISKTDFDLTRSQALAANANWQAAQGHLKAAQAQVALGKADEAAAAAAVQQAEAHVRQAQLNLSYTKIVAPRDGRVTARGVQLGNYLQSGQVLLVLVSKDIWVVANFKETQLTHMRPGQPVELSLDAYPGRIFKGKVDSLQAGTGARFSLLPPENAVGNYVKVVQRVPVKIIFDGDLPQDIHMAPGMSVEPKVKIK